MVRITIAELKPVILTPNNRLRAKILSVTKAIDSPKDNAILSMTLICFPLKNTKVQAKPGRKKTSINPKRALMTLKRSRKGKIKSTKSLIGDNQSIDYIP